jgi:hypothetical protein
MREQLKEELVSLLENKPEGKILFADIVVKFAFGF